MVNIMQGVIAQHFNRLAMFYANVQFLHPCVTMVTPKSYNLIGHASYEVLGQLDVLHFTRLSPAGVRGWLHETSLCVAISKPSDSPYFHIKEKSILKACRANNIIMLYTCWGEHRVIVANQCSKHAHQ